MADALTTITHLINSPPGQLAAGGVLAGIVWKFFERVESVLNEKTKQEIGLWLLGRKKFGPKVQPWSETFAKLFNRVYGRRHLSWVCFGRCCMVLAFSAILVLAIISAPHAPPNERSTISIHALDGRIVEAPFLSVLLLSLPCGLFVPGYISLLETRIVLQLLRRTQTVRWTLALLAADVMFTLLTASLGAEFGIQYAFRWYLYSGPFDRILAVLIFPTVAAHELQHPLELVRSGLSAGWPNGAYSAAAVLAYPGCVFSLWLWLYAGSGFILKAARRFDIGFDWFNRKFDIEKKPLQSIGLVAGALVAVGYWAAAIIVRVWS